MISGIRYVDSTGAIYRYAFWIGKSRGGARSVGRTCDPDRSSENAQMTLRDFPDNVIIGIGHKEVATPVESHARGSL